MMLMSMMMMMRRGKNKKRTNKADDDDDSTRDYSRTRSLAQLLCAISKMAATACAAAWRVVNQDNATAHA